MGSPQSTEQHPQQQTEEQHKHDHHGQDTTTKPADPPSKPKPENDAAIVPSLKSPSVEDEVLTPESVDVFTIQPVSALRLLCRSIDELVRMTGDVPPTPPVRSRGQSPTRTSFPIPDSKKSLTAVCTPKKDFMSTNLNIPNPQERTFGQDNIDGVPFKRTPIGSPEAHPCEPTSPENQDVGYNAPPLHVQYGALARKFYSKRPPPISTEEYLLRMHKYCPMSPAVYLATSCYITRLACVDRVLPVTPRNVHRLLLAGLRVAMKALEDLSWPHARFSKVGGVTEAELGRLEVTFCFLMDFGLKVDAKMLQSEAEALCRVNPRGANDFAIFDGSELAARLELKIPGGVGRRPGAAAFAAGSASPTPARTPEKRKASSALPHRPAVMVGSGGIEVVGQS